MTMKKKVWIELDEPMKLSTFMAKHVGKRFKIVSNIDKMPLSSKVISYREVRGTIEMQIEV